MFKRLIERFILSVEQRQAQKLEDAKARFALAIWPVTGGRLTATQAEAMEQSLKSNSNDLKAHLFLIGYYRKNRFKGEEQKCSEHQLWLIENEPRSSVTSEACDINYILAPEAFEQGKQLWLSHLKKFPKDPEILMNAAQYFQNSDNTLSESLLLRGKEIQPKNPEWSQKLAFLHSSCFSNEEFADLFKAFQEQEEAYKLAKSSSSALRYLEELPRFAFEAGEFKAAKKYSEQLLKCAKNEKDQSEKSQFFHSAYTTLGRLELKNNNAQSAKECLLKSAQVSGSPVLNSFGPGFSLAKELFDKNEKEIVIEYLKLCAKFWYQAEENLDDWTDQIRSGKFPDRLVTYR